MSSDLWKCTQCMEIWDFNILWEPMKNENSVILVRYLMMIDTIEGQKVAEVVFQINSLDHNYVWALSSCLVISQYVESTFQCWSFHYRFIHKRHKNDKYRFWLQKGVKFECRYRIQIRDPHIKYGYICYFFEKRSITLFETPFIDFRLLTPFWERFSWSAFKGSMFTTRPAWISMQALWRL